MEDIIDIIVTETTNTIEITSQSTDEVIDVNIIDNREDITLNVTPTLVEININSLTGNFGVNWGEIEGTLSNQTDLQDALNLKADLVGGKVPSSQLPSYVDDVVEVANYAALPATGETGKIYVTIDTNYIYRWTGSVYVEIKDSSAVWGAITGTLSSQTDLQSALNAKQASLSGSGIVKSTSGTISYLTDNSTNWNTAYNDSIVSASVAGTTTKTLTLTQQDGGTVTASWTDINTDAVSSVFGRTGAVVAASGDYTTAQVTEVTNLYYTDARARASVSGGTGISYNSTTGVITNTITQYTDALARAALSFTAGSGAYNSTTGVITIPTNTNQLTNGASFITLGSLSAGTGISYNSTTGVIASTITQYTDALARAAISGGTGISYNSTTGVITNTITQYTDALARAAISLTTTGTSGAATYNSTTGVLNIPQYQSVLTNPVTGTGTTDYLPKFTGASTIGDSIFTENGGNGLRIIAADANIRLDGSNDYLLQTVDVNGRFRIYDQTAAVERLTILSTGNVGIGTNNPDSRIHAYISSGSIQTLLKLENASATASSGTKISFTEGGAERAAIISQINTGTTPYLSFENNGAERMRITSGGNVGIGTTSPSAKLNVSGVTSGTSIRTDHTSDYSFLYSYINGASGIAFDNIGGNLAFYVNGAYRLRLNASGNLGLGVTPSAWGTGYKVFEFGNLSGNNSALFSNNVNDFWQVSNAYFDGTNFRYIATGTSTGHEQVNGVFKWYTASSGTAGTAISFTQAMTLFANGNLAVGTTTDAGYKLDVSGTGRFTSDLRLDTGASDAQLIFKNNASGNPRSIVYNVSDGSITINRTSGGAGATFLNTGAATFSSSVTAGGVISTSGAFGTSYGIYVSGTTYGTVGANRGASSASAGMNYYSLGTQKWFTGIYENTDNYGFYSVGYAGFPLTLNYTSGAATFSSTISAVGGISVTGNSGTPNSANKFNVDFYNGNSRLYSMGTNTTTKGGYEFHTNSSDGSLDVIALNISNTGAATFSSSVTINGPFADWAAVIQNTNSTNGTSYGLKVKAGTSGGSDATFVLQDYAGNEFFTARGNGRVGIGTNSPAEKLEVNGALRTTALSNDWNIASMTIDYYSAVGTGRIASYYSTGGSLAFYTNPSGGTNTERMRITSGGNILIGTTSDNGNKLQVTGSGSYFKGTSTYNTLQIDNSSTSGGGGAYFLQNGTIGGGIGLSGWYLGGTSNDLYLISETSRNIRFAVNGGTEAMRITSGGNVGIGTTSPNNYAGYTTLTLDGSSGSEIDLEYSGTLYGDLFVNSSAMYVRSVASVPLVFSTASSERMRITSGGLVGIGTSSPARTLDVVGTGRFSGDVTITSSSRLFLNNTAGQDWALRTNSSTNNLDIVDWGNVVTRMTFTNTGNVGIGTDTPSFATGGGLVVKTGATDARIALKNTASGDASTDGFQLVLTTALEAVIENRENASLRFLTNATEAMRITAAGNVLIGKTSGSSKFAVVGLPTSSAGLASGDFYQSAGVVMVVP